VDDAAGPALLHLRFLFFASALLNSRATFWGGHFLSFAPWAHAAMNRACFLVLEGIVLYRLVSG
jgi:hypothetical protein